MSRATGDARPRVSEAFELAHARGEGPHLRVIDTDHPDVIVVEPLKHFDSRGFLSEVFNSKSFASVGIADDFVQQNHTYSAKAGTIRGLHLQMPPLAASKLVRVVKGSVWDVAVDVRENSPRYGEYSATELSAANWRQMYIPTGFAHGFCTLEDDTEVVYMTSEFWSPQHEQGIFWKDKDLNINWPIDEDHAVLSDKDRSNPGLADMKPFRNDGPVSGDS